MIPELLDRNEQHIGYLTDCLKGIAIEERNGMLEAEITYQLFSPYWDKLVRGNLFVADINDKIKNQKFRIYKVGRNIRGSFTVYAKHISYQLGRDMIEGLDIQNQSCEYCLNQIFRSSQFSQSFRGYSDIVNAQDYKIESTKCLSAIGGVRGSILDTFGTGAEIKRDNYDFYVLNARGRDNGVVIKYGENMTDMEMIEDEEGLITRIRAVAKYNDENNNEIELTTYVDSPRISEYETPFVEEIDFSDKFEDGEIPTISKLNQLGDAYFKDNKCDIVKWSYKINFITLSKCVGYEDIEDKIELCDIATIIDHRYNLDTKAKVIKATYDFLRDRYESMEVGEPRTTLGDIITSGESQAGPQGPPGKPGADGKPGEEFPDRLPSIPVVTLRAGFDSIGISWTFEAKAYYNYEVYASQTKDFNPNSFDLIFKGQGSAFLHESLPNQTWYYRVCAINSYGNRTPFSAQVSSSTTKIADGAQYFENAAIKDALIADLRADRAWVGKFQGECIDARNLSVTDGNGKRTLDIDSFGNVSLDVTTLKIKATDVDKSLTEVMQTSEALSLKVQSMQDKIGQDLVKNGNFSSGYSEWLVPFSGPISPDNCRIIEHGAIKYISQLEGQMPTLTIAQLGISVKEKLTYTFKVSVAGDSNTDRINCDIAISQDGTEWNKTNGSATWGTLDKPGTWQSSYTSKSASPIDIKIVMWNRDGRNIYATDIMLIEPGGDYAPAQQVAELIIKAERIEQNVSDLTTNTGSSITQLSNQIKTKVDQNGVKSVIEQNPDSVKIGFNEINDKFEVTQSRVNIKASNGNKGLSFVNGVMETHSMSNGAKVGQMGTHRWEGTNNYGTSINSEPGNYVSLGYLESSSSSAYSSILSVNPSIIGSLTKGVNIGENLNMRYYHIDKLNKLTVSIIDSEGTLRFPSRLSHKDGSPSSGSDTSKDLNFYTSFDMHNWYIRNTSLKSIMELDFHVDYNEKAKVPKNLTNPEKVTVVESVDRIVTDIGNSALVNGVCEVELPLLIKNIRDLNKGYEVFISKYGKGDIWVSQKNEHSFIVKGDNDISFGYEIKAYKFVKEKQVIEVKRTKTHEELELFKKACRQRYVRPTHEYGMNINYEEIIKNFNRVDLEIY